MYTIASLVPGWPILAESIALTDPDRWHAGAHAAYGDRLYLPNARFSTPPGPGTTYSVNTVSR
jgi:hypothetical protein